MNLLEYIKGKRKGREANRIEKDALRDAFLFDALEGYDSVNGDHNETIQNLQKQIRSASSQKSGTNQFLRIASIVAVFLFGIGGYLLIDNKENSNSAQTLSAMNSDRINSMINVFVPEEFYIEHKTIIKKKNYKSKQKLIDIDLRSFDVLKNISIEVTEAELLELSREVHNQTIIEVYVPDSDYSKNETKIAKGNIRSEIIVDQDTTSSISIFMPNDEYMKAKGNKK